MADLEILDNYIPTEWRNYIPPSIDQNKLNHLEDNMKLNRDTINEIIKRLGIKPDVVSSADKIIYETPLYETLIAHRNEINNLKKNKLDASLYNKQLGDFTLLKGGNNLVEAINNRIRSDIDDRAMNTYTFKRLVLINGTSNGLDVTGSAKISEGLAVKGITSTGKVSVTHADGIETTKLKVNNAATFQNTVTVAEKITGNKGIEINGVGKINGTLTVTNLVVTGTISCDGNATFKNNVGAKTITASSTITADSDIRTKKAFHSTDEYIEFHWNASPLHKLYVHGGAQGLGSGDAFIQTVS